MIILSLAIIAVGWYAYQINQARQQSENADAQSWLNQQVQINKLKACIDENTKPCDIGPEAEQFWLWYTKLMKKHFGVELIVDLHGCDEQIFTEDNITRYFIELCDLIKMERQGEPMFWIEYGEEPHMSGISAVQFIRTSDIVIHTLDKMKAAYVNIFSCADFDPVVAEGFTKNFFDAKESSSTFIERKQSFNTGLSYMNDATVDILGSCTNDTRDCEVMRAAIALKGAEADNERAQGIRQELIKLACQECITAYLTDQIKRSGD